MHIKTAVRSTFALAALLTAGCGGEEGPDAPYVGKGDPYSNEDGYGPATNSGAAGSAAAAAPAKAPSQPDGADVVLASSAAFQAYLTDGTGHALYMFANDVPGANMSACTAACLDKWPVFDAKDITVGTGLTATDFARFQRADGAWQTAFKGHPLYHFTADVDAAVSGDGVGGRWYVARDYLAFIATKPDLTPQGASAPAPYMTNRMGRTVYVFMNDMAASGGTAPIPSCNDKCLEAWPTWNAPAQGGAVLPSSMTVKDFGQFERVVAGATVKQLTYRGWPLYFHTPDMAPGTTTGHMSGAWRAIDPAAFPGTMPAAASPAPQAAPQAAPAPQQYSK